MSQQRHLVADHGTADSGSFTIVPKPAVLVLGALCFMCFLGEGAVLDWSAVFLREQRQVDVSVAGIGYAAFSVAMAVMRLTGDRITHRVRVRRGCCGSAVRSRAAGYLAVGRSFLRPPARSPAS